MAAPIPPNPAPTMTASNCSVLTGRSYGRLPGDSYSPELPPVPPLPPLPLLAPALLLALLLSAFGSRFLLTEADADLSDDASVLVPVSLDAASSRLLCLLILKDLQYL
jgi:hypothetical protein